MIIAMRREKKRRKRKLYHIRNKVLIGGPGHDVGHGDEPLLPDGHLENSAPVLTIVIA